jgi:8-amino-7-oxononanoate synthase
VVAKFEWLESAVRRLQDAGVARDPDDAGIRERVVEAAHSRGVPFVDAGSNDYFGYARRWADAVEVVEHHVSDNVSRETPDSLLMGSERPNARSRARAKRSLHDRTIRDGAGASRLLGGSTADHLNLELHLASWVQQPSSLLFSSGYAANLGLLTALANSDDLICSDALNHASIVDGCRLSRAQVVVYPHLDLAALTQLIKATPCRGQKFVVTESYFSMDADTPDLRKLKQLADDTNAILIVDEAHALGVFGPRGSGLCIESQSPPDITVGTLGKSLGLHGAFVAAPEIVRTWLWNRARPFVFSTATPPRLARHALLHVKQLQLDDAGRSLLHQRAALLRSHVQSLGFEVPDNSTGPIVPIILGNNRKAIEAAGALRREGVLAYAVRPPTVPEGTARLRITVTASMSEEAFAHLVACLTTALKHE